MFLTENKVVYLSDFKEDSMDYEKIVRDLDLRGENIYETVPLNEGRKRMRLHQLTWEEKIQRKKLRNRIAAQTSRDRKKAKMDSLEESVKDLKHKNELLFMEIEELKKKNKMLMDANAELQVALTQRLYICSCVTKQREGKGEIVGRSSEMEEQICIVDGPSFERPAESSDIPQQKGHGPTSKCWETSRESHSLMTLKDWHQVCLKKLNRMSVQDTLNLHSRGFQELARKNASRVLKWWGRHQKNWNPVEVK